MVLVTDPVILSHLYPTEGGSTYNIGASPPEKVSGEHYVYIPTSGWTLFTEDKIPEDTDYTRLIPKEEVENSETLYLALVKLCDEQITPRADYLPILGRTPYHFCYQCMTVTITRRLRTCIKFV